MMDKLPIVSAVMRINTDKECFDMEKDAQALEKDHVLTTELIERLIERIEVTHEREIRVTFRFKSQFAFQGEVVKQCVNM